ncbi:MAG: DUF72 domain-containing protein [Hyphomicrobiaceae bacterium]
MAGKIRIGVGGWTYEPWRGTFYPQGLPHSQELSFASRQLTSIEINGTYYSRFKPDSWRRWRDETPDDFVFSVKASRYCTNRRDLRTAGEGVGGFLKQGLTELGAKLGPINWQLMPTKKFEREEMAAFLDLLPESHDGVALRHAIEVRHASFADTAFYDLARARSIAVVLALDDAFPEIEVETANFTYARLMESREDEPNGVSGKELRAVARRIKSWARRGDVFAYFISGAKVRNPAAAQTLMAILTRGGKGK